MPDARAIREWIERGTQFLAGMYNYSGIQFARPTRRAVVIGGGFIGLETAENLIHAGFEVTLVEMLDQLLAPLDREFARLVEEHVKRHGMRLALGDGVAGFEPLEGGAIEVQTKSGKKYPADVVILALGVRPDTALAKSAGLAIGERGGIRVDEHMRTSDPNIFAVGDAVEVRDFGTGEPSLDRAGGAGEPPGTHRRRRDRGTRFPLPRHAGHVDHRIVRRRRGLDGREREDACSAWATTTTRRSISSPIRTPATTRAPSRSR